MLMQWKHYCNLFEKIEGRLKNAMKMFLSSCTYVAEDSGPSWLTSAFESIDVIFTGSAVLTRIRFAFIHFYRRQNRPIRGQEIQLSLRLVTAEQIEHVYIEAIVYHWRSVDDGVEPT